MADFATFDIDAFAGEVSAFVMGLARESERAAVVLGAARLDVGLENVLMRSMRHCPGGSDNLFDSERPLASFSAKISIAHRLGLIDDEIERSLQLIRRIRNSFAHSIETETLSESAHKNRLAEVHRACEQQSPLYTKLTELYVNR